jgi:predicted oxidoreductase
VYGTWRLLREATPPTADQLARRLERCLELGITSVDTAEIYGGYAVEELLGAALTAAPGLRARMEIVTKLGIYVPNPRHPDRQASFHDASAARIVKSVDKSLRLLQTEVIDLLLIHRPDWLTAADDTAAGLAEVVKAGKVRHLGVSNHNPFQFDLLQSRLSVPLCTNQVELSLFNLAALGDGTLDQAQRLRRSPMAWSPLGGGRLLAGDDQAAVRLRPVMAELGAKYAGAHGPATAAELALAWVLAHPSRPVAILGTSRLDRLEEAARAGALTLERHDWYWLRTAAQGQRLP